MNSTTPLYDNSTSNVDSMNHTGFAKDLTFTDIILNPIFIWRNQLYL